jgi:integrase/recombinase XerD
MTNPRSEMRLYGHDGARLYINEVERRRFLATARALPAPQRCLCLILAMTGCRLSEALELTGRSVQHEPATIAIRSLKKRRSDHMRELPVPKWLINQIIADHADAFAVDSSSRPLFSMSRSTAWRYVKQVMACSHIRGSQATAKGLRHGFGVHALQAGVPLNLLQKWLGHTDIAITAIYGNAVGPEERTIAQRMW